MEKLPNDLEKIIIKKYLGDINTLKVLKCVSKKFSYIKYHKSNHVKCKISGWYVKNFSEDHICNVRYCMLTTGLKSYLPKRRKIK